jgi:hypothetical protein
MTKQLQPGLQVSLAAETLWNLLSLLNRLHPNGKSPGSDPNHQEEFEVLGVSLRSDW